MNSSMFGMRKLISQVKLRSLIDSGSSQFRGSWFVHPSVSVYKFISMLNCKEAKLVKLLQQTSVIFKLLIDFRDTRLLQAVLLVPRKSSYVSSNINQLNTDTDREGQWTLPVTWLKHSLTRTHWLLTKLDTLFLFVTIVGPCVCQFHPVGNWEFSTGFLLLYFSLRLFTKCCC